MRQKNQTKNSGTEMDVLFIYAHKTRIIYQLLTADHSNPLVTKAITGCLLQHYISLYVSF